MRKRLLILFPLLLAGMVVMVSCRFSGFSSRYLPPQRPEVVPVVIDPGLTKVMYKTSMTMMGNTITGITVMKKDSTGWRVAMVSELGLKYYELHVDVDGAGGQVDYLMEMMNRPPVADALLDSWKLLVRQPVYDQHARLLMNEPGTSLLLVNKQKQRTIRYYFAPVSALVSGLENTGLMGTDTRWKMGAAQEGRPGTMLLHHGFLSAQFTLMP